MMAEEKDSIGRRRALWKDYTVSGLVQKAEKAEATAGSIDTAFKDIKMAVSGS